MADSSSETKHFSPSLSATSNTAPAKNPSCIVCRKRKVKCDRKHPCSNCVKSNSNCIFRESVIPSRHHKRRPEDSAGTDVQYSMSDLSLGDSATKKPSQSGVSSANGSETTVQPLSGQFLFKRGKSLYLENDAWNSLGSELEDSDCISDDSDVDNGEYLSPKHQDKSFLHDNVYNTLFATPSQDSLANLHPEAVHIFKLWQIFLENVNPLTKIIHTPILQQQILNAVSDLGSIGRGLEALLFSIYYCALLAMTDEEAQKEFGQDKSLMQARFRTGAQRAFANADLMNTSDVVLLQAFSLYLVSLRTLYDRRTMWCLSGMAIRIAQQIGIHRDGSGLGLSIFETEMRRRVWWHIVYMDRTIARTCGFVAAPLPPNDTPLPLNINDSDLHPNMKESPAERHNTGTDMLFCQMRQELGKWQDLHNKFFTESMFSGNTLQLFSDGDDRVANGDEAQLVSARMQAVNELEETFKTKIIQCCDTSIPLHLLVSLSASSIVSISRLVAYHPSYQYGKSRKSPPLSQAERDHLFSICLDVVQFNEKLYTSDSLRRFLWQFDWHFPWPALLFMFSELPHRSILSEDTQRAWHYIDVLFLPQFSRLTPKARGPLHIVCIKLGFKAWNAHVDECRRQGVPVPPSPKILDLVSSYSSFSSKSRKRTPGQAERDSTFDSSSVFSSAKQEQSQQPQYDFPIGDQFILQPEAHHLAEDDSGNGQDYSLDNLQLPDFLGIPQDMPLNDGSMMMDWADWDPILQQITPSFGMSGF